jgi:hypothetical protein
MKNTIEIIPKFVKQISDIEVIRRSIVEKSNIGYDSQDARMVALDQIQLNISAVGMWINSYHALSNNNTVGGKFDEINFLKSFGSNLDIEETEKLLFKHLALGFITLVHFNIDNLFSNILKKLNALPQNTGYWHLSNAILRESSISEISKEKNILTALANFRNSLHSNGIHKHPYLLLKMADGTFFEFIQGKKVEWTWEHIIFLLNENIDVLGKILLSKKIISITNEIEDEFSSGKGN